MVIFWGDVQDVHEISCTISKDVFYLSIYDFQDYKTPKHFHITNNVIF